jgi:molecular chaperone GrpE
VTEHEPEAVRARGPAEDEVEGEAAPEVVETEVIDAEPLDPLQVAVAERDDYLDALRRLKAEFDNYRKRAARDQSDLIARASERLVKELLPVLDDLERALEAAAEHEEATLEDGVRLVHRSLADILAREGLTEVAVDGPFDPHTQEALLSQPSPDPEGTVLQVVQKGYRLGDRVLRPARVVISAGATSAGSTPEGDG